MFYFSCGPIEIDFGIKTNILHKETSHFHYDNYKCRARGNIHFHNDNFL